VDGKLLNRALEACRQIAEALEAAHDSALSPNFCLMFGGLYVLIADMRIPYR
jgi:hypothetical protein